MTERHRSFEILLAIAASIVIIAGVKFAEAIVVPFLLAIFIATIAATPVRWLHQHKVPNGIGISIVVIVLLCALVGIGAVITQTIQEFYGQQAYYERRLGEITQGLFDFLRDFGINFSNEELLAVADPSQAWKLASDTLSGIGAVLSNGFLIMLTVIFILAEGTSLPSRLRHALSRHATDLTWFDRFAENVNQYIAIKTAASVCTGVLVSLFLWLIDVDFALLWGFLAFLLNYIPNIGSIIAAAPAVLIALVQLGLWHALFTTVFYVSINIVMGSVIEPRFMGRILGLSTLVVFLSLILWGWMFGTVGMVLSVPLTMTAKIALESNSSTQWAGALLGPVADEFEPEEIKEYAS